MSEHYILSLPLKKEAYDELNRLYLRERMENNAHTTWDELITKMLQAYMKMKSEESHF